MSIDKDLMEMGRAQLMNEIMMLREGIRKHRDASGHDLCWYHPELWMLLPERVVPLHPVDAPLKEEFLSRCAEYHDSIPAEETTLDLVDNPPSDAEMRDFADQLIQSVPRVTATPEELAKAVNRLFLKGYTIKEIAEQTGRSEEWISNILQASVIETKPVDPSIWERIQLWLKK